MVASKTYFSIIQPRVEKSVLLSLSSLDANLVSFATMQSQDMTLPGLHTAGMAYGMANAQTWRALKRKSWGVPAASGFCRAASINSSTSSRILLFHTTCNIWAL